MATTANVLTLVGDERITYREMNNELGIACTARAKPNMITPGLEGYYLGLYDEDWANHEATPSGSATYYVRIVPIYDKMSDPDGNPLRGTPNTVNTTKGTTFDWDPFPDDYNCTGYEVWAGTSNTDASLYYQGYVEATEAFSGANEGQFNTHFVIGTTQPYNPDLGPSLSPNNSEIPPFASVVEIYQAEGDVNSRVFLGGGKKYDTGYAEVMQENAEPLLTAGTGAEDDYTVWDTVSDGSFRVRIDNEWFEIVSVDFLGVASMAAVATILQTALRQAQSPRLIGGSSPETTVATWTAIDDGSFSVITDGTKRDFGSIDFTGASDMTDVAAVIQAAMQETLPQASCRWDLTAERFIVSNATVSGDDQIVNGDFATDSDWVKPDAEWTISAGKANVATALTDDITNGDFALGTGWTMGDRWSITGGVAKHVHPGGVGGGGTTNYIQQSTLTPGNTYSLSFDCYVPSGGIGSFAVYVSGASYREWCPTKGQWSTLTLYFTAQSATIRFAISYSSSDGPKTSYIDNVTCKTMYTKDMYQEKASGDWNNKTWAITYTLSGMGTGERFVLQFQDDSGKSAGSGAWRTSDGTYTDIIAIGDAYTYNRIYLRDFSSATSSYSIDDISMKQVLIASTYLSYFSRHSTATGTDISEMMACRGTSDDVVLNRKGKAASLDLVEWSTDHFVFTRVPISELSDPGIGGTYIGGASWMNGESGAATRNGKTLLCDTAGDTTPANWAAITNAEFTMALYGKSYTISALTLSGSTTMALVASKIQAALRAATGQMETVTYNTTTTAFEIELDTDAHSYRLSFLEAATADVGTDISTATYLDALSTSLTAVYTPGYTALRSVVGTGVDWGEWAKGMRFRIATEGYRWLVAKKLEDYHLVLDEDYEGDGFNGFQEYVLEPYDAIVYVSNLGNPFRYDIEDRVLLPTADSDGITAINRVGHNIGVFMKHHTWLFNSADITAPRLISNKIGAYNAACVVEFNNGVAIFTGEDFVHVQGGRISSLDPEGRVREVIGRLSTDAPDPHGVYLVANEAKLLIWFMGLDSATVVNTAVVYDTSRGNWWLYNVKDVRCSVILRDSTDQAHLITGSSYDAAHGINAYTWLHGIAYKNDGALGNTVQGVIATPGVGSPTEDAGYLTCNTAGSATFTDWQAVTDGYFAVTIDDRDRICGPCDFSGISDMDGAATIIQNAIAAAGDTYATAAWSTDHFVITSGTATNRSDVSFLRPYYPNVTITDISGKTWINGQSDQATQTLSLNQITLTLCDMDDALDASLATDDDGEEGCYIYVCDTNMENGQYLKVISNTVNTVTVTPAPATTPGSGWYWFMGGIVPIWSKWFDFGSPQHKNKVFGVAVAVDPGEGDDSNKLALHGMQDLSSTVRTTRVIPIGGSADTVNSFHLRDKYATHQGLKLLRPNSEQGLKIRSITVTHSPKV